jgi:hypothetical protein
MQNQTIYIYIYIYTRVHTILNDVLYLFGLKLITFWWPKTLERLDDSRAADYAERFRGSLGLPTGIGLFPAEHILDKASGAYRC